SEGALTPFGYLIADLSDPARDEAAAEPPAETAEFAVGTGEPWSGTGEPPAGTGEPPAGTGQPLTGAGRLPAALSVGIGRSRVVRGAEIGTSTHVALAERAVADAVADAGLTVGQVALVVVKSPLVGHDEPARVSSAAAK